MKKQLLLLFILFGLTKASNSQNLNITLASKLTYSGLSLANVWGWKHPITGKEYALVGASNGLSIVDVSNPKNISQIVLIPCPSNTSIWREIRTNGNYAYVVTEGGGGLQIVDLSDLPSATLKVAIWAPTISGTVLSSIHALQIDNEKIYLYGSKVGNGGAIIADIKTSPMAPVYLGSYDANGYIHDGYVRNDTLYACHIKGALQGTCEIVDVRKPAAGVSLASFQTPLKFTHNSWLSKDGKTCFVTDEQPNSYLAAYDISNLANISLRGKIQSNPGSNSVVHNTYIINKNGIDYAVTSWYADGITIVNASDPSHLVQVGNYDTSPLSGSTENACWGVYPYLPSGNILASDMKEGLFVLSPTYVTGVSENTFGNVKVITYPNPFIIDATITVQSSSFKVEGDFYLALFDVYGNKIRTVNP